MIPNKSNFKFQELTPITGVKPYVIRFWETEFPEINPISSENGQKIYARNDVEVILKIKKLLFEDKLSIPEAKLKMSSLSGDASSEQIVGSFSALPDYQTGIKKTLELIQEIKAKRNW